MCARRPRPGGRGGGSRLWTGRPGRADGPPAGRTVACAGASEGNDEAAGRGCGAVDPGHCRACRAGVGLSAGNARSCRSTGPEATAAMRLEKFGGGGDQVSVAGVHPDHERIRLGLACRARPHLYEAPEFGRDRNYDAFGTSTGATRPKAAVSPSAGSMPSWRAAGPRSPASASFTLPATLPVLPAIVTSSAVSPAVSPRSRRPTPGSMR